MFMRMRYRAGIAAMGAGLLVVASASIALGAPNPNATCVGLASSFFAGDQVRDDVAHAIKVGFGIPPGAEVSRFARVQLGHLEACLIDGQG
jgi:hypothetical protein